MLAEFVSSIGHVIVLAVNANPTNCRCRYTASLNKHGNLAPLVPHCHAPKDYLAEQRAVHREILWYLAEPILR